MPISIKEAPALTEFIKDLGSTELTQIGNGEIPIADSTNSGLQAISIKSAPPIEAASTILLTVWVSKLLNPEITLSKDLLLSSS